MISPQNNSTMWISTTAILFEEDDLLSSQLQKQFAEFSLHCKVLYDEDEVLGKESTKPHVFLLPIRGLGNRLVAIQQLRSRSRKIKVILISKDETARFIALSIGLGANAVISRYKSAASIARLSIRVATQQQPSRTQG